MSEIFSPALVTLLPTGISHNDYYQCQRQANNLKQQQQDDSVEKKGLLYFLFDDTTLIYLAGEGS